MIAGLFVLVLGLIAAFLTLDLLFRSIDLVQPRQSLRRAAIWYFVAGGVGSGLGLWLAWHLGGTTGLLVALAGVPVWWVLWRFGLRKQFPHLFPGPVQ